MKTARVAWLDGLSSFPPSLPDGPQLVQVEGLENHSPYLPLDEDINAFREAAEAGEVDVVVIGNNTGSGRRFAKVVPEALLSRSIIVFNGEPRSGDSAEYSKMGIRLFCARSDVLDVIAEAVAAE
jgi:hypothetical protein